MNFDNKYSRANASYSLISEAITYIKTNFRAQPNLDEIAESVHLSPYHFHRLFSEWAGISPKKFLQYVTAQYAKEVLTGNKEVTLFDVAHQTGLSGTSRLHDLFVTVEGMTPAEYKNGGKFLTINYSFSKSPFGEIIVASTDKGICHIAFAEDEKKALENLKHKFPNASYQQKHDDYQHHALSIFQHDWSRLPEIKLHLKGTDFQLKVWETLLKIPMGKLSTYGKIAEKVDNPSASRAVGTAVGSNPIAFIIPCHRVIQSTGTIGGYMWGSTRKSAMIGWEAAMINQVEDIS
ncbi:methylated-DNA--[protein]-cysteine S-methyltransferase [soil metagenome]